MELLRGAQNGGGGDVLRGLDGGPDLLHGELLGGKSDSGRPRRNNPYPSCILGCQFLYTLRSNETRIGCIPRPVDRRFPSCIRCTECLSDGYADDIPSQLRQQLIRCT